MQRRKERAFGEYHPAAPIGTHHRVHVRHRMQVGEGDRLKGVHRSEIRHILSCRSIWDLTVRIDQVPKLENKV